MKGEVHSIARLRQAHAADIPALHRIRMAVRENVLVSSVITPEDYVDALERTGRGWLVEVGEEGTATVVGFAIGNASSGNIWALFVDPAHEGQGHGRRLHDAMVAWLFAQGLERLWLSTDPGTRAQRFYEAAGWRFSGTVEWGEAGYELFRPRPQMPMMTLPIDTPSLRLRHLVVEDAARMMELNGEPSTRRWLPSHVYEDASVATARMCYLISCYASPGDPRHGPIVLAVEHIASGTLLGHVGFSPFEGEVEVSYAIAEQWRGRGYGCEALLHACKWAAESFDLPGILGLTESENKPSRRTLERAAFVHVEDTRMRFQGSQQPVSRYLWRRSWSPG